MTVRSPLVQITETAIDPREVEKAGVQPFAVRFGLGELLFDLVIGDDAARRRVDEEHLARLQSTAGDDLGRRNVQHATLAGEDDAVVDGAPPASRS